MNAIGDAQGLLKMPAPAKTNKQKLEVLEKNAENVRDKIAGLAMSCGSA